MILEVHSDDLGNAAQGTLVASSGRGGGLLDADTVAATVQEIDENLSVARAYVLDGGQVRAVWLKTGGAFTYIARHPAYASAWELPCTYPGMTSVVTAEWGRDILTMTAAETWAANVISNAVATAVLINSYGIIAAWEHSGTGPRLVAKGPSRPL